MTIDFKKHLLTQLQSHTIYYLPDVEVINSDIEFALAVWKNFNIHSFQNQSVSLDSWYSGGNWKVNLDKYKEDIDFWTKALKENNFDYDILLHNEFQKEFPFVVNYYLKNNERLEELYNATGKEEFFNLINLLQNEKDKIKQYYCIEKGNSVSREVITQYEHDKNFVLKLLTNKAYNFKYLNESNKNNPEYIRIALAKDPLNFEYLSDNNKDNLEYIKLAFSRKTSTHLHKLATNFHHLSLERKESLFPSWLKHFGLYICGSDVPKLNENQREEAFKLRPELLEGVLQHQSRKYGALATKLLNSDFNKYIAYMNLNMLSEYYTTPEDLSLIKKDLELYINQYIPKTKLSKKDKNILYLIKLDESLTEKLNNNMGYQINEIIDKPEKISEETFFKFVDGLIKLNAAKEINEDQSESCVKSLRSKLDSSVQKELKLPKEGAFNYLCMLKLNEKLHATLPNKVEKQKNKI